MNDRDLLIQALKGNPEGFSRTELSHRLRMNDRAMRDLIEDVVSDGEWAILPPTITNGVYRLAREHEYVLVDAANREDKARAKSSLKKARGRYAGFVRRFQSGALFLEPVNDA